MSRREDWRGRIADHLPRLAATSAGDFHAPILVERATSILRFHSVVGFSLHYPRYPPDPKTTRFLRKMRV